MGRHARGSPWPGSANLWSGAESPTVRRGNEGGTYMYRIVASDMDETFLGSDHGIPEANVRAVGRLREEGVLFVPASGRSY